MQLFQSLKLAVGLAMEIEKNLKISPWEGKAYLPRAYGPWEESFSSRGLIFGGFFNPWDEEISIPETRPIRKSYISQSYYHTSVYFLRSSYENFEPKI